MVLTENELASMIKESIKNVISESTLNRIEKYINDYDCACITAWRNVLKDTTEGTMSFRRILHDPKRRANKAEGSVKKEGEAFTLEEKKYYNRVLKAYLLKLGYGVTNVLGSYREAGSPVSNEESFFVVNLNDDVDFFENIAMLGEKFNQDSVMISPKGTTEGFLLGTNASEFPGYGNKSRMGNFLKNVQSMFMSRIGNAGFSFTNGYKVDKDDPDRISKLNDYNNNYEDDERKTFADRKKARINPDLDIVNEMRLDTYDSYSINGKRAITSLLKEEGK